MKDLFTLPESASPRAWEIAASSGSGRESAAAPAHDAQPIMKNPVVLALRRADDAPPETDGRGDRFRIANEIIQQLGWSKGQPANSTDGAAVWAFRERSSKDQVKRTRAELEAYLGRAEGDEFSDAHRPRQEPRRRRDALPRNPILAMLADHRG